MSSGILEDAQARGLGDVDPTTDPTGSGGAPGVTATITGNMDDMRIGDLATDDTVIATSKQYELFSPTSRLIISGTNFTYDANAHFAGGTLQTFGFIDHGVQIQMGLPNMASGPLFQWILDGSTTTAFVSLFAGDDFLGGDTEADLIHGFGGNDAISGNGGADTIFGGTGNDTITADQSGFNAGLAAASTYLRGDDGDDVITGGSKFDDINGNQGNDTCRGGDGDDWVVGGKDNDLLFGDNGGDIVWGNLGNDTLDGGDGNDQVRGGQGNDSVSGGPGNDYVSGDRGDDTITGGSGADIFHGSQDAGIDNVLDFSLAEGDKVMLDPGTTFTVSQVGADTVIDMGGGNKMVLFNVQMSSLPPGTIFLG